METFAQIIDLFGGPLAFSEAIGIPDSHARAMKARNSIPLAYWARMVRAAKVRGIKGLTVERLVSIAELRHGERASQ